MSFPPAPPIAPPQPQMPAPIPYKWVPPELTLSPEDTAKWWGRITTDRAARELRSRRWKQYFAAYLPTKSSDAIASVKSNIHFRNTETKLADVWAQFPELVLTPQEPLKGIPQLGPNGQPALAPNGALQMENPDDVVSVVREVLMSVIEDMDADLTIRESAFDLLQTSGVAGTKIHYQSDIKLVPPQAPPQMPGSILGLSEPPPPPEPVAVNERYIWEHFSPEQLGIPSDFRSTRWDNAPYLFMEFAEPFTPQAAKSYNLPPNWKPTSSNDDRTLALPNGDPKTATLLIKGVEIWLKAAFFDENEPNRDVYYRLVLIEGQRDKAAVYEFSPYQSKDEQGRLTFDSMIGNPIHPIALRVASDTAWIDSDAAFTDPLVQIKDRMMQNDEKRRQANLNRFFHAASVTEAVDKLKLADTGQGVAVADDLYRQFPNLITPIPHLEHAQSDLEDGEALDNALTQTLGIGPGQAGAATQTNRSATENAIIAAAVNARLKKDQTQLLKEVLRAIPKIVALIQRFMTDQGYVQIVGTDGVQRLHAFNAAHLRGRYAFKALPDSQLTIDQESRKKNATEYVNFMAKSQFVNQLGMARIVTNAFGYDPSGLVQVPPPQPPKPDPISTSLALKAPDLAIPEIQKVLVAQNPELASVFNGMPPSPQLQLADKAENAKVAPNLPHGGGADKVDLISKHTSEQTGNQPGVHPLHPVEPLQAAPVLPHPATH